MHPTVLEIEGLHLRWPGAGADTLRIGHLALHAGERLLLHGASGAGKSTLLSLAAGVLEPTQGTVSLLGRPWGALAPGQRDARRADHVGYLFQQFNLLPYMDVLRNVLLPCAFSARRRANCQPEGSEQHAKRLLDALELEPSAWRRRAGELSIGQQQRVAAARALIGRPELVVADEPTSALDDARRDAFMRLLQRQCEATGCALLFVSHDRRLDPYFTRTLALEAAA